MEWVNLPYNLESCPEFKQWVKNFYLGGYIPTYARKCCIKLNVSKLLKCTQFQTTPL